MAEEETAEARKAEEETAAAEKAESETEEAVTAVDYMLRAVVMTRGCFVSTVNSWMIWRLMSPSAQRGAHSSLRASVMDRAGLRERIEAGGKTSGRWEGCWGCEQVR